MTAAGVKRRAPRHERLVLQEISKALENIYVPMFEWQNRAITLRSRAVRRPGDGAVAREVAAFLHEVRKTRRTIEALSATLSQAASSDSHYLDGIRSLTKLDTHLTETAMLLGRT